MPHLKLLELRLQKIDKYIDRWEARNRVTLMHYNRLLDVKISVVTCSRELPCVLAE